MNSETYISEYSFYKKEQTKMNLEVNESLYGTKCFTTFFLVSSKGNPPVHHLEMILLQ